MSGTSSDAVAVPGQNWELLIGNYYLLLFIIIYYYIILFNITII